MKPTRLILIVLLLLAAGFLGMIGGLIIGKPASHAAFRLGILSIATAAGIVWIAVNLTPAPSRRTATTSILSLLAVVVVGSAVFGPLFISARVAERSTICHKNLKDLSTSMQIYMASSDDVFPPADRWSTLIGHGEPPKCPVAKSPYSYAMNRDLSSVSATEIAEVYETVLVFEMDAQTPNASGTEADVVDRHGRRPKAVMVDGSVGTSRDKRWTPGE